MPTFLFKACFFSYSPERRLCLKPPDMVVGRVKELLEGVLLGHRIEFVDALCAVEYGRRILRVYIDKPGGVTLEDCEWVSRELSTALDVEDIIAGAYTLEVSSPGLDRALKTEKDFKRFAGRKAHIKTKAPIDGRRNFSAIIDGVEADKVLITDTESRKWEIELQNIDKARLEF